MLRQSKVKACGMAKTARRTGVDEWEGNDYGEQMCMAWAVWELRGKGQVVVGVPRFGGKGDGDFFFQINNGLNGVRKDNKY